LDRLPEKGGSKERTDANTKIWCWGGWEEKNSPWDRILIENESREGGEVLNISKTIFQKKKKEQETERGGSHSWGPTLTVTASPNAKDLALSFKSTQRRASRINVGGGLGCPGQEHARRAERRTK